MPARAGSAIRRLKGGIPHVDLEGRHRQTTIDEIGDAKGETYTFFTFKACTVQPATATSLDMIPVGFRDEEVYHVFTSTDGLPAISGSNSTGDQIKLPARYASEEAWFTIIKRKAWQNGILNHYDLIVVKDNKDR